MSIFSKIGAFFGRFGVILSTFLSAGAAAIVKGGGKVLIEAARDAVRAAEVAGGTGSEKRAAAIAVVVSTLTSKGLPVLYNAVFLAIEAAVAEMNKA